MAHLLSLLVDLLSPRAAERVLCFSQLGMELPLAVRQQHPSSHVTCFFLDAFHYQAAQHHALVAPDVHLFCGADLPAESYDAVLMPVSVSGEAELTRDLMQQAHERLAIGGRFIAVVDNPRDHWLKEQIETMFGRVQRTSTDVAAGYLAYKREPLRKQKDFGCEFVFRDREHLLHAYSRPGVFSHRRVDPGARQLLATMEIVAGERVLDIGCGSGVVALAAAVRGDGVHVEAIDANARAVQCTARGAELNGLTNVTAHLGVAGQWCLPARFDVVLANPPYFASFRIAESFLWTAGESLRPSGVVNFVTKSPEWYVENVPDWLVDLELVSAKGYFVVRGRKAG